MDITKLKNNYQYYDDSEIVSEEVVLLIKESPEFNIHIDEGYFMDIFGTPIFNGKPWVGFTRDYQEDKGGWKAASEIKDIDEYISDMLRYRNRERHIELYYTEEVFDLVIDFLTYAKETGQTVIVEVD